MSSLSEPHSSPSSSSDLTSASRETRTPAGEMGGARHEYHNDRQSSSQPPSGHARVQEALEKLEDTQRRINTRVGRNLLLSTLVGAVLIAVIVASLMVWPWGFALFLAASLCIGVIEVGHATERTGARPLWRIPAVITPAMILLSYAVGHEGGNRQGALATIAIGLAVMSLASLVWRLRGEMATYIRDVAATLFVVGYVPLLGSALSVMLIDADGPRRILISLACVVATDTGAFFTGVALGKHKMAPLVSPNKTWEGLAGGVISSIVVGILGVTFWLSEPLWLGILLGAACAIAGTLGDLVESAIKRSVGLSDMGHILPGHGGAMDRLDSILAIAPVAWAIFYLCAH